MDDSRWERITALFHALADLPADEQQATLTRETAGDPELAAEVRRMLAEDARADSMLDRGLADVAGELLANDGDAAPREIGNYRLLHVIGEGGMGVVFLAERREVGGRVAIKILRDAWLSPARRERFASEERTLAQLTHPSIAQLHDAGTLPDGTPWFAMEHVEGEPITRYCAQQRCDIRRRLAIFREACEAVLHAHQRAVIHRDLKPSNILVALVDRVKLLDFGIAKTLDEAESGSDRTRTALRMMTPAYAAPEQRMGGALGVHTDIYSLGVLLYELLTGHVPFDLTGETSRSGELVSAPAEPERPSLRAARGGPPGPDALPPGTASRSEWSDLDVLCATAMHAEPARRYRTVDSLIRDIDHFLRGEPLEARPDSFGYRTGKFLRRHRAPLLATATFLVLAVSLAGFYTVRLRAARNAAVAETERTRQIQDFMTSLFEGSDSDAGPSDTLRVVTLLAAGVREARSLSAQPAIRADLEQTLGRLYQKLGDLDRADTLLGSALALRQNDEGVTRADLAAGLLAVALLRLDQSRYEEADSLANAAVAMQRVPPLDPAGLGRAMTVQGQVLEGRGDYPAAIAALEEAARLDSLGRVPDRDLGATLTELANCHFYAGHYATSDSINRQVLALDRAVHGARHPNVASDLINLGAIQQELGHYAAAESLYRQALTIYRGWFGEQHFETAATLTMIGRTLLFTERRAEADSTLRRALAIRERVYGPDHPAVASTLNELGRLAQQEGRLDDAARNYGRMLAIYRKAYADRHYLIGVALSNLAGVSILRGRGPEAESMLRDALRRFHELLGDDHPQCGITRIKLGRALLLQRRYEEAAGESLGGYTILSRQADPAVAWLDNARTDLFAEYTALGRASEAEKFRAELAHRPPR